MRILTIPTRFTAIDKFTGPVDKMGNSATAMAARTQRAFRNAGQTAMAVGRNSLIVGAAIIAPLGLMAKSAVEFEDRMADVAKTTGLSGAELTKFGDDLLNISKKTRTSIDDLLTIGEIGGQLGIAKTDMLGFVESANKFNVALGKDFAGGVEEAITSIGKIKSLFKDTRGLNIADSITKTGSAINQLGSIGAATSQGITDFTLRMGALPDNLKDTAANTMALGAYFEEMGLQAEVSAGGMSHFLLVAGRQINGFAKQMKISSVEAKQMLAQNPTEFAKKFAASFKGMAPDKMAKKLHDLKIGTNETIKVIGALGSSTERLTTLQTESNAAYAEGTSLNKEYDTKNKTMAAQLGKLKNNVQAVSITLGNALLPVINSIVEKVIPLVDRIGNWITQNKGLTATIIKMVAGFGVFALAVSAISFSVGIVQKATVLWNAALLANPIGLVIVAVAGLSLAIASVTGMFDKSSDSVSMNADLMATARQNTIDQRVEVELLFDKLKRTKEGTDKYTETLQKLDKIQPGITDKYDLQTKSINKLNTAKKELIYNIIKEGKLEAAKGKIKELTAARFESDVVIAQRRKDIKEADEGDFWKGGSQESYRESIRFNKGLQKEIDKEIGFYMDIANSDEKKAVNVDQTANESQGQMMDRAIKAGITIDFKNMPSWVQTTQSSGSNFMLPSLGNTRE